MRASPWHLGRRRPPPPIARLNRSLPAGLHSVQLHCVPGSASLCSLKHFAPVSSLGAAWR